MEPFFVEIFQSLDKISRIVARLLHFSQDRIQQPIEGTVRDLGFEQTALTSVPRRWRAFEY